MKKLLLALALTAVSSGTVANTCDIQERYKFLDANLAVNDVLSLSVGNITVTRTVDDWLANYGNWHAELSKALNLQLNAATGSSGSLEKLNTLGRYVADGNLQSTTIIDLFDDVPVSLTLNGQDFSSHLELQTLAPAASSGEIFIPHWFASTNRHLSFFVTNKSDANVNVDIDIQYYNGNPYAGSYSSQYAFSGNNPVASTAVLEPGEQGQIGIGYLSGSTLGHATVSWNAQECLTDPITVTLAQFSKSGGMSHFQPK